MLLEEGFSLLKNNIELKTRNCTNSLDKNKSSNINRNKNND